MKTIIVATDYSQGATSATIYAAHFAAETETKIVLFHLHHMSIHALNGRIPSSSFEEMKEASRKKLSEAANKLSEKYKIEVIPVWRMGNFEKELQATVDSSQAKIVVMGMANKSIEQDLLGNTTTALLNTFKFPILVVPLNAVYKGLKTILYALDITRGIHKKVLEEVKEIALPLGATIEIFHVSKKVDLLEKDQKGKSITESFEDGLNGTNYYYKNVASNTIIEAIQNEIIQIQADLLIMVPYKYGFWDSIVHISKTRIMTSRSEIPLLSIPL